MLRASLFVLALCLSAGCVESEPKAPVFEVENVRLVRQRDGSQRVSGIVRNTSERTRSAQLEIALYGAQNVRIGEVHVPVERIGAGEIKGFDWSLDVDVAGARVRRILLF